MKKEYEITNKPWMGILIGILFSIIGIIMLFISVKNIKSYNEKNDSYIETIADVIDYNYNDEGLKAIIVQYKVEGNYYQKASNTYSTSAKSIGSQINIKYNPEDPNDVIWSNDSSNFILPIVGAMFLLFGIVSSIVSIKNNN